MFKRNFQKKDAKNILKKRRFSIVKERKDIGETYKLLEGEDFPFGKYPLDTIEIDHTDLNVILVDRIERKPLSGKPHLI